ncbi:MAG TPA: hypothetical protein VIX86_23560 [Streptosporangiaceae bacterium]
MNGDVEELLREGLDRLTADVRVPAGMVARARTHVRRRKIAARAALACGTAAVTAAAVIAATGAGARPGTGGVSNARTTAYVIKRVQNALADANFVIYGQATGSATFSVGGHQVRSGNGPTSSWTYGNTSRMEEFTGSDCGHALPDGSCTHRGGSEPYLADGTALIGGKLTGAYVTYFDHKYSLSPLGDYHLQPCSVTAQLVLGGPAVTMPDWPAFIKAMLGCGTATVTGHARIGGVATIVISGSVDVPLSKDYSSAVSETRARVRYILYVDSATYLPVRAYGSTETYGGTRGPTIDAYVTNVQWLAPTAANIAQALVTIPPGYTQVNSPADQ